MSSYLELKNILKKYRNKHQSKIILKNINLEIKQNEFITILGPSGCGKSSLLKLIAGFIQADQGQISKNGKILKKAALDRVMLFQEFEQLFPWQKVIENVIFAIKASFKNKNINLTKVEIREKALLYLEAVKLKAYQNYYPHQLSGGMKQRAALARTLAAEAEIMLMDEPFASVDSQTRHQLQQLLFKIWQQKNMTIIFVTHDIREAIFLADKIVLMKNEPGEIIDVVENNLAAPRKRTSQEFNHFLNRFRVSFRLNLVNSDRPILIFSSYFLGYSNSISIIGEFFN